MFSPRYEIKVTLLRLQMLAEELPAQVHAPALAGCAAAGAPADGSLGHLQHVGVITVAEQLRAQRRDELAAIETDRAAAGSPDGRGGL